MNISKKFKDFAYFIFPFINGLKNLSHFLHFKLMITLSVTCLLIINVFLILVNDTFSSLKGEVGKIVEEGC